jgi:long-subunit fatty acid transport protein
MLRIKNLLIFALIGGYAVAQNDQDALRYSRNGVGGTSRFVAMGGAFGALGADFGVASTNPSGLGVFRKGEIAYSAGFRSTNNTAQLYGNSPTVGYFTPAFGNFGLSAVWRAKRDADSRHVIAVSNSQLQNFRNTVRMSGYTNNSSIAKDMLSLAIEKKTYANLNLAYEGLGFDTYLIDSIDGTFISLLDVRRSVKQTRDIVTSGKVNDLNFSYAFSLKDKFYFGGSLGFPQINYESTMTHKEWDDKDSIRIGFTSPNSYTHTFIGGLPALHDDYINLLAFKELTYTEYFKTTGGGFNLKMGGIVRLNDLLRVGVYYHSSTVYRLQDSYYNSLSVTFDGKPTDPISIKDPADGGYFKYRIVTPPRYGASAGFTIKKLMAIGLEYEVVNYGKAQLISDDISDFAGVNAVILSKYTLGHNVKAGAELNLSPIMLRAGYVMQGSPFGEVFVGDFVRNTFSVGAGLRTKSNLYFDIVWATTFSDENYYLFTRLDTKARVNYQSSFFGATVGVKF